MKKLALIAALAAITAAPAYAGEGFYAVGSVGWSRANFDSENDSDLLSLGATGLSSNRDKGDTGYKLQLGYQFNDNFAIEGGYIDFGKTSYSASYNEGSASTETKARGVNINLVGIYPINEQFSLFGKAGAIDARVKASGSASFSGVSDSGSESKTDVSPTVGFGGTYKFDDNFGIRAEYEYFHKVGDKDTTGEANINLVSAGLVYKF